MKKNNIFKTLLLSSLLSGCALLPGASTGTSTGTSTSTGPGSENNNPGAALSYNEIKDLLENGYKNFTAKDGVSIKLANSSFDYLLEEFSYSNDKVTGKFEGHVDAKDVNLDIKLKGLKTATKVNDFDAAVVASGDLHVFEVRSGSRVSEYNPEGTTDLAKGELDAAVYFENGKLYASISEFYKETMFDPIYPDNFYYDLGLEGVEGMLQEMTGLAFPLLSDANVEAFKQMIDESMKDFDFEESFGFEEAKLESLVTYFLSDLFTVNKKDNNYYLSLNLTKDNLLDEVMGVMDALYENGFFALMMEEEMSADDFKAMKDSVKPVVEEIIAQGFNHVKLNVAFTNEMIKSVSVDVDFKTKVSEGYVSDGNESHLTSQGFMTAKAKVNFEFDYSDNVNITFPNFNSYVDYEEYFSNENVVKYINAAANTDEPFDYYRVNRLLGYCCDTSEYDENTTTVTYYPEYDDYIDLALAMENGEDVESIVVVYDENDNAVSATYSATSAPVTFETWQLLNYVYDHTYEELVAVFGTPYEVEGEPTDYYMVVRWLENEYRGFEVYFEYGVAYDYNYFEVQY